jgi:putative transposase
MIHPKIEVRVQIFNLKGTRTMKRSRFTEEQIIKVLDDGKTGISVEELCRKYGVSKPTYYSWKTKFGGMVVSEVQRLRALEAENSRLKRIVADQALDLVALKDVLSKKW